MMLFVFGTDAVFLALAQNTTKMRASRTNTALKSYLRAVRECSSAHRVKSALRNSVKLTFTQFNIPNALVLGLVVYPNHAWPAMVGWRVRWGRNPNWPSARDPIGRYA